MILRKKLAYGVIWSLVERIGNQGVSFLIFMFVARLIGPVEYGLASICLIIFSLANIVLSALVDGIVSLQISDTRRLSTLFWCAMGVGGGLCLLCVTGAREIAVVMGEPRLQSLLQWLSPVFLCLAALTVPNKLIYCALDFKVFAIRTLVGSLIGGAVGLIMALQGFGAHAIIAQQLVLYVVINVIVWRCVEWRPSFVFDASTLGASLRPGLKLMGADFISFSQDQIPRLLIGFLLGPMVLGYYAFVIRIRRTFEDLLINPFFAVLYPYLAKIKFDHVEQKLILGHFISLTGFLIFPTLAWAVALAPTYVPLFFGAAWEPATPILQIFICGSAVQPILVVVRETLRAHNRLGSYMRVQLPIVALGLLLTLVLAPHGLLPVSVGLVVWTFSLVPFYIYVFRLLLGINLWEPVTQLIRPLAATMIMLSALSIYQNASVYPLNGWLRLLASFVVCAVVYFPACFVFQFHEMMRMILFVRGLRSA